MTPLYHSMVEIQRYIGPVWRVFRRDWLVDLGLRDLSHNIPLYRSYDDRGSKDGLGRGVYGEMVKLLREGVRFRWIESAFMANNSLSPTP